VSKNKRKASSGMEGIGGEEEGKERGEMEKKERREWSDILLWGDVLR